MSGEERERSPRRTQSVPIPNWKNYRCFAVGVGYSGEGYFGFQIQPGDIPTVERDIQKALLASGLIDPHMVTEEGRQHLFWSHSARTDKGVHACVNVIACRMDSTKIVCVSNSTDLDQEAFAKQLNAYLPDSIRVMFVNRVIMRFDARTYSDRRYYEYYLPRHIGEFSLDADSLNKNLQLYVGTHCFWNFTRGMKPNDKAAVRHIVSIQVREVGEDFLCVRLLGQSFLLNQIRKMVSLAVEVSLSLAPADAIEQALTSKEQVFIHLVPGEGLILDRPSFKAYDLHKCGDYTVTTPFNWLVADEESDGDLKVMTRIEEFKTQLVNEHVLPGLRDKFDEWVNLIILPNGWDSRHNEDRSTPIPLTE